MKLKTKLRQIKKVKSCLNVNKKIKNLNYVLSNFKKLNCVIYNKKFEKYNFDDYENYIAEDEELFLIKFKNNKNVKDKKFIFEKWKIYKVYKNWHTLLITDLIYKKLYKLHIKRWKKESYNFDNKEYKNYIKQCKKFQKPKN